MLKTVAAAGALVASVLALPSAAQAQEANSMRVSYADLDLASRAGQGALQHRIVNAAKIVCVYGVEDPKELELAIETNGCRAGAVSTAWPAYQEAVANARHGTVTVIGSSAIIVAAPAP
jgi:UrcA family protein